MNWEHDTLRLGISLFIFAARCYASSSSLSLIGRYEADKPQLITKKLVDNSQ